MMEWLLGAFKGKYLEKEDLMQRIQLFEMHNCNDDWDDDQRIAA